MTEKRRFSRIIYQAPAQLEQRDLRLNATIQDLSLHGLLLQAEGLDTLNPALWLMSVSRSTSLNKRLR